MALITGASALDIISDIGINYLFDEYADLGYAVQGTEATDLDLGAALVVSSGSVSVTAVKTAIGTANINISGSMTATAVDIGSATLSISSSVEFSQSTN